MIKSKFDNLYDQPGPAPYAHEMRALNYRNPDYLHAARPQFDDFVARHKSSDPAPLHLLDVCAGYGINALTLRHGLENDEVYDWLENNASGPPKTRDDTAWLANGSVITGLDIAANALAYAKRATLIDQAICANLESGPLQADDARLIRSADILISTGSLSYISERTVGQLLAAIEPGRPLLALFWPLLGVDISNLQTCLEAAGMTVTHDQAPLWQRQYKSEDERARYLDWYRARGIRFEGTLAETGLCATHLSAMRS